MIIRVSGGWDTSASESTYVLDPPLIGEPKPCIFYRKSWIMRVSAGWDTESTYVLDLSPIGQPKPMIF